LFLCEVIFLAGYRAVLLNFSGPEKISLLAGRKKRSSAGKIARI